MFPKRHFPKRHFCGRCFPPVVSTLIASFIVAVNTFKRKAVNPAKAITDNISNKVKQWL